MKKKQLKQLVEQKLLREDTHSRYWRILLEHLVRVNRNHPNRITERLSLLGYCTFLSFIKNTFVPPSLYTVA